MGKSLMRKLLVLTFLLFSFSEEKLSKTLGYWNANMN